MNSFSFRISEEMKKNFPNHDFLFTAEQIDECNYKITWGEFGERNYTKEDVEEAIKYGSWVVKPK